MEPFQLSSLHDQCSAPLSLIQRVDYFRKEEGKSSSDDLTHGCSEQSPGWTPQGSDRHLTRPRGLAAAREPNWLLT